MNNQKVYIDSHTHLDWYENQELLIKQLVESEIHCLAASVDAESFEKNKQIAKKVNERAGKSLIIPTFGIHPCKVKEVLEKNPDFTLSLLYQNLLMESPIIGEIGMDFCWYKEATPHQQEMVFRYFLEHCNEHKKYCVIHTKDAEQLILDILKEYPDAKPIIHWYDGPEKVYKEFVKRGYSFTFGCETCRNEHIQQLLKQTPVEQLLCETDNPTGEPWLGGSDNSPMLIKRVYSDIAQILKIPLEDFIDRIEKNYNSLFN